MAPWSFFQSQAKELPSSIAPNARGVDTAFEVFIDGALTKIYNEASGRSKEQRAIREACKRILGAFLPDSILLCEAGTSVQAKVLRFPKPWITTEEWYVAL